MRALNDLAGEELLRHGYALKQKREEAERKKQEYTLEDPSICHRCGQKRPAHSQTLTELGLEFHPKADEMGVVTWYGACETPECVALAAKAMNGFSPSGEDLKMAAAVQRGKLDWAGIGGLNMRGMTFEGFNTEWPPDDEHKRALRTALDKVLAWSTDPSGTLILSGPYGIGKTRLAVAALRKHLADGASTGFHFSCVEGWNVIKAMWDSKEVARYRGIDVTESELLSRCQKARLLVLDDMDKVRPGETFLRLLLGIFNYRSDHGLPTIVTINRPTDQLAAYLKSEAKKEPAAADAADALISRLMFHAVSIQFRDTQPDFRKVYSG